MENQYIDSISRASNYSQTTKATSQTKSNTLSMDSFLVLMAQQLQNQDPMNPTSQDNYMMQLAQMAVVEAMTNMTQLSVSTYATSMVGKEVTVADYDSQGNVKSVTGTVTSVALYYDEPVIYINDKGYAMSQIMSVGSVPTNSGSEGENSGTDKVEPTNPDNGSDTGVTEKPEEV